MCGRINHIRAVTLGRARAIGVVLRYGTSDNTHEQLDIIGLQISFQQWNTAARHMATAVSTRLTYV